MLVQVHPPDSKLDALFVDKRMNTGFDYFLKTSLSGLFLLSPYMSPTSSCQSSTPYWSTLEYRVTFSGLEVCQILCKQGKDLGQKEETRLISIVSKHDNMYEIRLILVLLFCCFVVLIFFLLFFPTWKLPYLGNTPATLLPQDYITKRVRVRFVYIKR